MEKPLRKYHLQRNKRQRNDVGLDICDVSMIYSSAKCGKLSSRN